MRRILIIKTGASGDVVRTTTLLHLFASDRVTWITKRMNIGLLPLYLANLEVLAIEDIEPLGLGHFDLVISLDDELACAQLASQVHSDELLGVYADADRVRYKAIDATWFEMSLISEHGLAHANALKKANHATYQELIFGALGRSFGGEPYLINTEHIRETKPKRIGLEARSGDRWPTKVWHQYDQLAHKLTQEGFEPFFFEKRETMGEFIADVSQCAAVVTGDTLAMHFALALQKPTVAIFTCTSATEIHGYGLMQKVISPLLHEVFYTREYRLDALEAISVDLVYGYFLRAMAIRSAK